MIGIFTFHTANNVGTELQAYALKTTVQKLCNDVVHFIPYSAIEWMDKLFRFDNIKLIIKSFLGFPIMLPAYRRHKEFQRKHLSSEKLCSRENLMEVCDKYRKIITGSDQVWNFGLTHYDSSYMLDFLKGSRKKVSYAASFGFDKAFYDNKNIILPLLADFSYLSTRESIGYNDMLKYGLTPMQHIDPSLLLDEDEYILLSKNRLEYDDYLFIYEALPTNRLEKTAYKYAKEHNLKVVRLCPGFTMKKFVKGGKKYIYSTPDIFLSLIKYAKCVFTTSFHGVAFSLIFRKPFLTEINKDNLRVETLLDLTSLHPRAIDDCEDDNLLSLMDESIDWESVMQIIEIEKKRSFEYLSKVLAE